MYGNRRGSYLVNLIDVICVFHFLRWPIAVLAFKNKKVMKFYYKVRIATWYLHIFVSFSLLVIFILFKVLYDSVFMDDTSLTLAISLELVLSLIILPIDFHWCQVIKY